MITDEEIKNLAKLAKLEIPEEKFRQFADGFAEIIGFADLINREVEGDNAAIREVPAPQIALSELRADEPAPSLPQEKITSGVQAENGYFPVRRVVK